MSRSVSRSELESDAATPPAPRRLCLNCHAALSGPYCSQCGQHDIDYHRSFYHLTHDLLENLFHFDGKFLVSVAWLLAKPGRLTNEFNAGRRHSQVHPLRFYIFATVLCFLGVHLLNHGHLFKFDRHAADQMAGDIQLGGNGGRDEGLDPTAEKEISRLVADSTRRTTDKMDPKELATGIRQISERAAKAAVGRREPKKGSAAPAKKPDLDLKTGNDGIGRALSAKFASGELTFTRIVDEIEGKVPTMLFLGMPIFALLLKGLYFRSGRYYIEHLIFSLHLHTWMFLVVMVGSGYLELAALGPPYLTVLVGWALAIWMTWYVRTSFRTVYAQGWKKTALKIALLAFGYGAALTCLAVLLVAGIVVWLAIG